MPTKLQEKQAELAAKQAKLTEVFEKAGPDLDFSGEAVRGLLDGAADAKSAVEKVQEKNKELEDLGKEVEELRGLEKIAKDLKDAKDKPVNAPSIPGSDPPASRQKSIGQLVVESEAFKSFKATNAPAKAIVDGYGVNELKTLFQTSAGWAPESTRIPGLFIDAVTRPIQVIDIIPSGSTNQAAIVYMTETTRTHASAERAENAAYAESAFVDTETSSTVRSIGTSIPVTDEQLEDVAGVQSYLENRLVFGNRQRLDYQVLQGDGVAPNLTGILNHGDLQTQAKGIDSVPAAYLKAMTLVRVTGRAMPNAALFHSNDWQAVRLLQDANGNFLWGPPSQAGPEMIWGVRVIQTECLTENTGLVGDFNYSQLYERRGMEVLVGYVNDDFLDGRRTIRAGFRVAFAIYRGAAFATVTGI
jgi:HK97 family phage major capsid protein